MPADIRQERSNSLASGSQILSGAFTLSLAPGSTMLAVVRYYDAQVSVNLSGAGSPSWAAETVWGDSTNGYTHAFLAQNIGGSTTAQLQCDFKDLATNTTPASVPYPELWIGEVTGVPATGVRLGFAGRLDNNIGAPTTDAISTGLLGTLASQPALIVALSINVEGTGPAAAGTGFTAGAAHFSYDNTPNGTGIAGRSEWMRVTATTSIEATFTGTALADHTVLAWALLEGDGDVLPDAYLTLQPLAPPRR